MGKTIEVDKLVLRGDLTKPWKRKLLSETPVENAENRSPNLVVGWPWGKQSPQRPVHPIDKLHRYNGYKR